LKKKRLSRSNSIFFPQFIQVNEKENIFLEHSKSTDEANQLSSQRKRVLGTIPKMISNSSKKTSSLEKVNNQSTQSLDGLKVNPLDASKTPKVRVQKNSLNLLKNHSNKENQQFSAIKQNSNLNFLWLSKTIRN
jgi:hypothetical protein